MTGTNDKLRSLFLTTLMVLSVVAGTVALSGSAAALTGAQFGNGDAQASQYSKLISNATIEQSSGQFEQVTIDFSGASANGNAFDGSFDQVTDGDVSVVITDGAGTVKATYQADAVVASTSNNDRTITVQIPNQSVSAGNMVEVRISNDFLNPSTGGTYTGAEFTVHGNIGNTSTGQLTVAGQAGDGGGAAGPTRDANFTSGRTRYQGMLLYFQNDTGGSNDYSLNRWSAGTVTPNDGQVTEFNPGADSQILLDTSSLSAGQNYAIVEGSNGVCVSTHGVEQGDANTSGQCYTNNTDASIYLAQQNLNTSWAVDSVPAGGSATFNVDSNRVPYTVEIGASGLTEGEIAAIFGVSDSDGDGTAAVRIRSNDASLSGDFSGVDQGEYTFTTTVADTGVSDTATINVTSAQATTAEFARSSFSENTGDWATITVDMTKTDNAVVTIGSEDVNYKTSVRVLDTNDDGQATFQMNTYLAGRVADESRAFRPGPDSGIGFVDRQTSELSSPLEPHSYSLSVRVGNQQTDNGVLRITDRSTNAISLSTAPSGLDSQGDDGWSPSSLQNASFSTDGSVARGDLAVFQVDASGLYGYVESKQNFTGANKNVSLTMVETGENVNAAADTISNQSQYLSVYPEPSEDNLWIVLDTDASDSSGADLAAGNTYNVTFTVTEGNPLTTEAQSVSTEFTVTSRTISYDMRGDRVTVQAAANQTITGTTSVAPGTTFTVFAESSDETPLFQSDEVTVQEGGTFTAQFDFSNATQNETFTVRADGASFQNPTAPGVVMPKPTASLTFNDQTTSGEQVVVASATLSNGGFVVIQNSAGDVIGSSSYLSSGSHSDVTVTLDSAISSDQTLTAVAYMDDGNQQFDSGADQAYTNDAGEPVSDTASITVGEGPTPGSPTPTPTAGGSPTPSPSPEPESPSPSPTPTGPGFGVVVSVLALIGAALLAIRRS